MPNRLMNKNRVVYFSSLKCSCFLDEIQLFVVVFFFILGVYVFILCPESMYEKENEMWHLPRRVFDRSM